MPSTPLPLISWSRTGLLTERVAIDSSIPVYHAAVDLFVLGYPKLANKLIDALYEYSHGIEFADKQFGEAAMVALYDVWRTTDTMPPYIKNPGPDEIFNDHNGDVEKVRKVFPRTEKKAEKEVQADEETENEVQPAEKSVEKEDVVALYRHIQEQWDKSDAAQLREWLEEELPLHQVPKIWNTLKDAEIGKALNIDEDALEAFITEGCNLIKQRFTTGPTSPYANHSISDLIDILDECHKEVEAMEDDDVPDSLRRLPMSDEAIAELVERLSNSSSPDDDSDSENAMLPDKHLPPDYLAFLQATNGFEDEPGSQSGLFCCVQEVGRQDITWLHDLDFTLFEYTYNPRFVDIDSIPLGDWSGFCIGAGGDEGNVVLIPPTYVRPVLEAFERAYEVASKRQKRAYERAAVDMYGGLDKLRQMKWLCVVSYHWDPTEYIYAGFRPYLEYCVEDQVKKRQDVRKRREQKEEERRKEMAEKKRKASAEISDGSGNERKSQRNE